LPKTKVIRYIIKIITEKKFRWSNYCWSVHKKAIEKMENLVMLN